MYTKANNNSFQDKKPEYVIKMQKKKKASFLAKLFSLKKIYV